MIERGNLIIDGALVPEDVDPDTWDADAYERSVVAVVETVEASVIGTILLSHVINSHIHITPYRSHHGFPGAWTSPGIEGDAAVPQRQDPVLPGHGAALVSLSFTPDLFPPAGSPSGHLPPGVHAANSAEVLVHELVHAVEIIWGTLQWDWWVGPTATDVAGVPEHRAVRVANMFHSEQRRPLRGPYNDRALVESSGTLLRTRGLSACLSRAGTFGFRGLHPVSRVVGDPQHDALVAFESALAHEFVLDHPSLTMALEHVPRAIAPYNPFADYLAGSYDTLWLPETWMPPVDPPGRDPYRFLG